MCMGAKREREREKSDGNSTFLTKVTAVQPTGRFPLYKLVPLRSISVQALN